MPPRVPPEQLKFARALRQRMTRAEAILWTQLRGSRLAGAKFRRQVPLGPYVADFLCVDAMLIVELDGAPHEREAQRAHDDLRDAWLTARGYCVLRIPNDLIFGGCELALQQIAVALARQKRSDVKAE